MVAGISSGIQLLDLKPGLHHLLGVLPTVGRCIKFSVFSFSVCKIWMVKIVLISRGCYEG